MSILKGRNPICKQSHQQLQIARQYGKWCVARIDQSTAYNLSATVGGSKIQFQSIKQSWTQSPRHGASIEMHRTEHQQYSHWLIVWVGP